MCIDRSSLAIPWRDPLRWVQNFRHILRADLRQHGIPLVLRPSKVDENHIPIAVQKSKDVLCMLTDRTAVRPSGPCSTPLLKKKSTLLYLSSTSITPITVTGSRSDRATAISWWQYHRAKGP